MHRSLGAIHSNQIQETIVPASLKREFAKCPQKRKKDLEKDEGAYSRRRKTWFEVAGVRVVTRLHEIFMVSPEEVHLYLRLPLDDSWGIPIVRSVQLGCLRILCLGRFPMNMRNPCMEETKVNCVVGNPTFWTKH
jgi:hypothetical protein